MKSVYATLTRRGVGRSDEGGGLIRLNGKRFYGGDFGGIVPGDFSIDRIDARHNVQGVLVLRFCMGTLRSDGELYRIAKKFVAAVNGTADNCEIRCFGVVIDSKF